MKRTKTRWLLAGVLCLALSVQISCIKETSWDEANAAGVEAFQEDRYGEAEKWWLAALEEAEDFGPDDQRLAVSLNNLALLHQEQGQYAEAEPLFRRALAIFEKALGPEHPNVAANLDNLAGLFRAQGKYAEAEPLFKRLLAIYEKALGPEHPDVAISLNNLALLYHAQGKNAQAEPLYRRAIAIDEKALGLTTLMLLGR